MSKLEALKPGEKLVYPEELVEVWRKRSKTLRKTGVPLKDRRVFNPARLVFDMANELAASLDFQSGSMERFCVYCGCSDSRACRGGCSWAVTHKATSTGVCSNCVPEYVKEADAL